MSRQYFQTNRSGKWDISYNTSTWCIYTFYILRKMFPLLSISEASSFRSVSDSTNSMIRTMHTLSSSKIEGRDRSSVGGGPSSSRKRHGVLGGAAMLAKPGKRTYARKNSTAHACCYGLMETYPIDVASRAAYGAVNQLRVRSRGIDKTLG